MSVKTRGYVTYFNQRYIARAHVMLRSLRRHDPAAEIFALCFDEPAQRLTAELGDSRLSIVSPQELYDLDPALAACRDRGASAFRATHKPALALYALRKRPDLGAVAHIDADAYFFSTPEPLFAEIGEAPIALSPHRFVFNQQRNEWVGRFNAGFIYWKNDVAGRRCLIEYRVDCIDWCAPESMPDGRFMNQGYLTRWPQRYPGVHIIRHPGVNLAPWNIAGHSIDAARGITVDGVPLIFFHFSGLVADDRGRWRTGYTEFGTNLKIARRAIYAPYLEEVERAEQRIARRWPGLERAKPVWDWRGAVIMRRRRTPLERAAVIYRVYKQKLRSLGSGIFRTADSGTRN
jgi:hypothetical protein